jgi:internalin A
LNETDLVPETEKPEGEITMPATTRDQIFISYSHKDKKLFQEVKTMLAPAIQKGIVNIWDDTMIRPGAQWKAEIEKALASARVGVLLVSENFLESEFITKNELPPLLKAAQDGGATIFWVYLSPCLYQHTEIEQFQAAHDISRPLSELTKPRRKAAWREICNKLLQIAQNP